MWVRLPNPTQIPSTLPLPFLCLWQSVCKSCGNCLIVFLATAASNGKKVRYQRHFRSALVSVPPPLSPLCLTPSVNCHFTVSNCQDERADKWQAERTLSEAKTVAASLSFFSLSLSFYLCLACWNTAIIINCNYENLWKLLYQSLVDGKNAREIQFVNVANSGKSSPSVINSFT